MNVTCPECEAEINLNNPLRGDIVVCPDCGTALEITSVSPVTLELAPETEEDFGE